MDPEELESAFPPGTRVEFVTSAGWAGEPHRQGFRTGTVRGVCHHAEHFERMAPVLRRDSAEDLRQALFAPAPELRRRPEVLDALVVRVAPDRAGRFPLLPIGYELPCQPEMLRVISAAVGDS